MRRANLLIRSRDELTVLPYEDIVYFEVRGRKLDIHMQDGAVITYNGRLQTLAAELDERFFRCHRSYIVHLKYISSCRQEMILLTTGDRIPLSRLRDRDFRDALLPIWGRRPGMDVVSAGLEIGIGILQYWFLCRFAERAIAACSVCGHLDRLRRRSAVSAVCRRLPSFAAAAPVRDFTLAAARHSHAQLDRCRCGSLYYAACRRHGQFSADIASPRFSRRSAV